jgi:hypothetical protein
MDHRDGMITDHADPAYPDERFTELAGFDHDGPVVLLHGEPRRSFIGSASAESRG